jgi:hypothetical protein
VVEFAPFVSIFVECLEEGLDIATGVLRPDSILAKNRKTQKQASPSCHDAPALYAPQ